MAAQVIAALDPLNPQLTHLGVVDRVCENWDDP